MRSDGALHGFRVHLDATVIEERDQAGPVAERVAHGLCQIGRTGHLIYVHVQPVMQHLHDRSASLLSNLLPVLDGLATDLASIA